VFKIKILSPLKGIEENLIVASDCSAHSLTQPKNGCPGILAFRPFAPACFFDEMRIKSHPHPLPRSNKINNKHASAPGTLGKLADCIITVPLLLSIPTHHPFFCEPTSLEKHISRARSLVRSAPQPLFGDSKNHLP